MVPVTLATPDAMMFSALAVMDGLGILTFLWQRDDTIILNSAEMETEEWIFTLEDGSTLTKYICSVGE